MWKPNLQRVITAEQKAAAEKSSIQAAFEGAIQTKIDAVAQSKNYADGTAFAGYVNSNVPQWKTEAQAFIAWRDAVWIYAYAELAKALAGQREIPTVDAFLTELPTVPTWQT